MHLCNAWRTPLREGDNPRLTVVGESLVVPTHRTMSFSVAAFMAAFLHLLFLLQLARQFTGLYESSRTADRLADSSNDSHGLNLLFTSDEVGQHR